MSHSKLRPSVVDEITSNNRKETLCEAKLPNPIMKSIYPLKTEKVQEEGQRQ